MCKQDLLFYINAFVWTYDPRQKTGALPFITYEFQDETLLELQACIGHEDVVVEKSRDMGASWLCLLAIEHRWRFEHNQSFLLGSRNEDYVDKSGDPKSLFWKLDFINNNLPKWLVPKHTRAKLHLENEITGSVITGESTTGNFARGDRRTAVLLDEFAYVQNGDAVMSATADVTLSRILNSTPNGTGNAFYSQVINKHIKKIRLHWTRHPVKARGWYTDDNGDPRSPWYDKECLRRTPMEVAQELDIDYHGSGSQFFDAKGIDLLENNCKPPMHRGELEYEAESSTPMQFHPTTKGHLLMWCNLIDGGGPPNDRRYCIGADIATGSRDSSGRGASNSVASIVEFETGHKVGEFAISGMDPVRFARYVVALCKWFHGPDDQGAMLIWESNGPGTIFGKTVVEDMGYRNIYWRRNESSLDKKVTRIPGFFTSAASKHEMLGMYRSNLFEGIFVNWSYPAVRELRDYVHLPNGGVAHIQSTQTNDATLARDNHGDRVIADALACKMLIDQPRPEVRHEETVPTGSVMHRMQAVARERRNGHSEFIYS